MRIHALRLAGSMDSAQGINVMLIPLSPGDRVIAAFPWQDKIVVVTEQGRVFQIARDFARDDFIIRAM